MSTTQYLLRCLRSLRSWHFAFYRFDTFGISVKNAKSTKTQCQLRNNYCVVCVVCVFHFCRFPHFEHFDKKRNTNYAMIIAFLRSWCFRVFRFCVKEFLRGLRVHVFNSNKNSTLTKNAMQLRNNHCVFA